MEADSSPCAGVRPGSGDAIVSAAARSPATEMGLDFGGVCSRTFPFWGPFLFRIVDRPAFFFSRDERILGLLAHIEMGQRDGPSGRLVVVAHGLTYAFSHYCAQWTEYQPVCCLI